MALVKEDALEEEFLTEEFQNGSILQQSLCDPKDPTYLSGIHSSQHLERLAKILAALRSND